MKKTYENGDISEIGPSLWEMLGTHTVERKKDRRNNVLRGALMVLTILLQLGWLYLQLHSLQARIPLIGGIQGLVALVVVLGIYGRHLNASMKLPWIILISIVPFFGIFAYVLTGYNFGHRHMRRRFHEIHEQLRVLISGREETLEKLEEEYPEAGTQARYLSRCGGNPVYDGSSVKYFDNSSDAYAEQIREIAKARKFVFMEYHAIEDAVAFRPLHEALKERAAAGVEVRLFYDYVGSIGFLDDSFIRKMEKDGIKCRAFNPIVPFFNLFLNNRDHRKITVIDGRVGFTGGYNLADEYFNITHPYGHWLDTGIRVEGDAVKSMTITFLENWNSSQREGPEDCDFSEYLPEVPSPEDAEGYVQPYAGSPMNEEKIAENAYMNVLNQSRKYAWFVSPYLIITDEMAQAFCLAAKRGVDVRIITPGIPDKRLVYRMTRSYYGSLVRSGVRIYEYTPGFSHCKMCVADDMVAICGTINLDYRSLYHHFENGCFLCGNRAVTDIRDHFERIYPECREVTADYRKESLTFFQRGVNCVLRLFAPLL